MEVLCNKQEIDRLPTSESWAVSKRQIWGPVYGSQTYARDWEWHNNEANILRLDCRQPASDIAHGLGAAMYLYDTAVYQVIAEDPIKEFPR